MRNASKRQTGRLPKNDESCGWLAQLPARTAKPPLKGAQHADWLVIGAGFTGMAAARQLCAARPHDRVILLEANRAAEGASARNSGFLVDATLNEGTGSAADIETFRDKFNLNLMAAEEVEAQVKQHAIACDWDRCGKLYAARHSRYSRKLERFAGLLQQLGLPHEVLQGKALQAHAGTDFYSAAVWTKGSVLLQPAKLARGLLDSLPQQVELYENSPVVRWVRSTSGFEVDTVGAQVAAKNLVFAVNGFMPELRVQVNRSFALQLTASMSRPLSEGEYHMIGAPRPYGLLSVDAMGATIRLTADRRILVRNTCEVPRAMSLGSAELEVRKREHARALVARFPALDPSILTHSWSGIVCLSMNGHHVFGKMQEGLFLAGCYNANGIGTANLLGREIANMAAGQDSAVIPLIQRRSKPAALPPQPFLAWGARLRLMRDAYSGRSEN